MTMSSPTVDRGDGALDGFDEDSELHMGVISMSGDAQEIMGREARGEPPRGIAARSVPLLAVLTSPPA